VENHSFSNHRFFATQKQQGVGADFIENLHHLSVAKLSQRRFETFACLAAKGAINHVSVWPLKAHFLFLFFMYSFTAHCIRLYAFLCGVQVFGRPDP
jgi:hypothetical protein